MELEQLVVFAILMQHGEGVISKAPSYILEKAASCERLKTRDRLRSLLDPETDALYLDWLGLWLGKG